MEHAEVTGAGRRPSWARSTPWIYCEGAQRQGFSRAAKLHRTSPSRIVNALALWLWQRANRQCVQQWHTSHNVQRHCGPEVLATNGLSMESRSQVPGIVAHMFLFAMPKEDLPSGDESNWHCASCIPIVAHLPASYFDAVREDMSSTWPCGRRRKDTVVYPCQRVDERFRHPLWKSTNKKSGDDLPSQ